MAQMFNKRLLNLVARCYVQNKQSWRGGSPPYVCARDVAPPTLLCHGVAGPVCSGGFAFSLQLQMTAGVPTWASQSPGGKDEGDFLGGGL